MAGAVRDILDIDVDDLVTDLDSLTSVDQSTVDQLQALIQMIIDVSQCVRKDRLRAMDSEAELEDEALDLAATNSILAGQSGSGFSKIYLSLLTLDLSSTI